MVMYAHLRATLGSAPTDLKCCPWTTIKLMRIKFIAINKAKCLLTVGAQQF